MLVKVKWLGIVNILAGREVVREFIQGNATSAAIAGEMRRLLGNGGARSAMLRELDAVIATLGEPGAAGRAADAMLRALSDLSR
jgi:lipid-A-disaccharide synthase